MTVKRVWRGWATPEKADSYQKLLHDEVIPSIEAKEIPGFRRIEVLRFDRDDEVEFMTIMTFDDLRNVIDFQGEDYTRAYVPEAAQRVLKRWDQASIHYHLVESRNYVTT